MIISILYDYKNKAIITLKKFNYIPYIKEDKA